MTTQGSVRAIEALEIHVAHSCNLTCESCSHYSNQGHTGTLALDEADRWMKLWNKRVSPRRFSLLGGEPTIHPQLTEMVAMSRRNWPDATLQLVTNGFLLPRHPSLPDVLGGDANAFIALSIHHTSPDYRARLMPVISMLLEWKRRYGVQFECRPSHGNWTRRYRGFGSQMMPFNDGRPRQSWEHCHARLCKQLFEGKIWKCPALAYLPMQHEKYNLADAWRPYLAYEALSADCSDEELDAFISLEDESFCSMCPSIPEHFQMPSPLRWHQHAQ